MEPSQPPTPPAPQPSPAPQAAPDLTPTSEASASDQPNTPSGKVSPPTPGHLRHYKLFFIIALILIVAAGTVLYIID